MQYFSSASFCILIAQLIVQPDYWEGDVLNRFVVILTDLSSARHYKVDSWQLLSVNFSSLALISMYVLFWKAIQHVQPEYFSKKTTCLAREGRKVPIWNGRCSLGSDSVVREKSKRKGKTVREPRQEKMKKKKNHELSGGLLLGLLRPAKTVPPPPPPSPLLQSHYLCCICIPVSFWSDLDCFCSSVLTLKQKHSQMFFTGWCDLTRRRTKWDRRGKSLRRGGGRG